MGLAMVERDLPRYTTLTVLQMTFMSTPFLPKASRFSKHAERIEGSTSSPDCE